MRKLTLALSTTAFAMSGAAFAQTPAAPVRAPQPDVTRAQAQARAEASFARMDVNQDGTVNQADRAARKAQMFDRMDTDKNGSISRAELDAHHAKRGEAPHASAKARGGHRMTARSGKMDASAAPLTRQAFVDRALGMFDKADANRDGTVTQAERKAVRASMREQWKAKKTAGQQG